MNQSKMELVIQRMFQTMQDEKIHSPALLGLIADLQSFVDDLDPASKDKKQYPKKTVHEQGSRVSYNRIKK